MIAQTHMAKAIELRQNEVHLWVVPLEVPDLLKHQLEGILSPEEQQRAKRFHFERDRQRYVVARATVRLLLEKYLQYPASDIIFAYNEFGKPFLASPMGKRVHFNVSHSDAWGLIGITRLPHIGVDIEKVKSSIDVTAIGKRFFAAGEVATLLQSPEVARLDYFFSCWTRKEAFIKAIGKGLTFSLQDFEVELQPELQRPRLKWLKPQPEVTHRWHFFALEPVEGFKAAVAVFTPDNQVPEFQVMNPQTVEERLWKPLLV